MMLYNIDIDSAYPESYSEEQSAVADKICRYLNEHSAEYNDHELDAVVRFVRGAYGIAIEFGWGGRDCWFPATSDMAYDEYAQEYCDMP